VENAQLHANLPARLLAQWEINLAKINNIIKLFLQQGELHIFAVRPVWS